MQDKSQSTIQQTETLKDKTNNFFKNRAIKHGIMLIASPEKFGLLAQGVLNDPAFGLYGLDVSSILKKTN